MIDFYAYRDSTELKSILKKSRSVVMIVVFALLMVLPEYSLAQTNRGLNNYFYKVVKKNGNVFSFEECKQSDRPIEGWVASAKYIGTNVKKNEPKFYKRSMWTTLSFNLKGERGMVVTQEHFTGTYGENGGDMWTSGIEDCKEHFASQNLKKR